MNDQPTTQQTSKNEDTIVQLYWALLETWSAQVDSYWTRTNYFAAFEAAAIAGTWALLNAGDLRTGHWCAALAPVLTLGWIFSNLKSYDYHAYWWNVLEEIEASDDWKKKPDYVSNYEKRRKERCNLSQIPYSFFTNWIVPIVFFVVWVYILWFDWNGTPKQASVAALIIWSGAIGPHRGFLASLSILAAAFTLAHGQHKGELWRVFCNCGRV